MTPDAARQHLEDHKHWQYRGCAPDPDMPTRAQGDLDLSIDAWAPYTEEGGEERAVRNARQAAAVAVCRSCPVLAACRTYALTVTTDDKLAEPEGVWGAMTALERHRNLIARLQDTATAPDPDDARLDEARTAQKQALLKSLARETDEELVAYRAGMDVRTSNWHRAILTGLLGLDKETASRQQLLERALELGLLPAGLRIVPDGRWPIAAAPNTDGSRQRRIAPGRPVQLPLPGFPHLVRGRRAPAAPRTAGSRRPRLRIVRTITPLTLPLPATSRLEPAA